MKKIAPLLIMIAGTLWGLLGVLIRLIAVYEVNSLQIAFLRCVVTAICLGVYLAIKNPNALKIDFKDLWYFIGTGLLSIVFFTTCYFTTIQITSLSVASILLYTAPIFVMFLSLIFFKEKLTSHKILAAALAFIGCICISGLSGNDTLSLKGFVLGLCAGFGYALYSIFGTVALRKYQPLTVTAYTFIVASVGSLFIAQPLSLGRTLITHPPLIGYTLLIGILGTVLPYCLYTLGLKYVTSSEASIMASVEPLVATLSGVIFYQEPLTLANGLGILLILGGVIILNISGLFLKKKTKNSQGISS